ncbi:SH3 domain-containing protein [Streptococcus pyogenes]|uniref:SH3 domain-containing protein n=1 Tax=Streptococcus pyogenes TaxID=1314 RepID=UPI000DFE008D|nr:SH3 domain-containing protein [Streptococcus pyogenes]SUO46419.1 bacterial SH3 domain protein [Streptococcus pyogenes]HEP1279982.1 SH3 domain-containing protein [Streptococcus pyogenes]
MKKFHRFLVSGVVLLGFNGLVPTMPSTLISQQENLVHAAVLGDNYPSKWKKGNGIDSWNMYIRQCTSFAAFRLSSANGFQLPKGYGNACTWGHIAKKEYNYNAGQGPERYHKRQIPKSQVSGYIHFKDLSSQTSHSYPRQLKHISQASFDPSGTYHFTTRLPVKGQTSIDSPDLAYYEAGQSVYYDKVVTAGGYTWLSYLSFSGNRRYIPIKEPAQSVVQNDNTKPSIKVGDTVTFPGVFRVDQLVNNLIVNKELAGGDPTPLNWIDPTPLDETDNQGKVLGDQILRVGEYFTVTGSYKVLKIDQPSNGIYVQIGSRGTWVNADKANKL